ARTVKEFVKAEGLGRGGMIVFVPKSLEVPEAPPISLAAVGGLSEADAGDRVPLPGPDAAPPQNPLRLPAAGSLLALHLDGERSFVNYAGFGFVPREEPDNKGLLTSAFKPHQFPHLPELPAPPL